MDLAKSGLLGELLGRGGNGRPPLVSVLDPGTEYAKALVVQLDGDRVVVVGQGVDRHEETPFERGTRAVDLRLQSACEAALLQAEDMCESTVGRKLVPDHLVLAFPSQWVRQGAFSVLQRRHSPAQEITTREFRHALVRAERLAVQQLANQLGVRCEETTPIGSEITEIRVGGHAVSDPLGFRGDTLELTVFNAVAENRHLAVMGRLTEHLELELAHLVTEEHSLADSLPVEEAIVIDAGSSVTSLGWIRAGCPYKTATLPFGGRRLTERLASEFGLSPVKGEALKLRFALGELDSEACSEVWEALLPGLAEWLARIESGLAAMAGKNVLPPFIYVSGGASNMTEFADAIRGFPWLAHLPFARYPEVQVLGPGEIPGVYNRTGRSGGREMTVAMALARWAAPRKRMSEPVAAVWNHVVRKHVGTYGG